MHDVLRDEGYSVVAVRDGAAALQALHAAAPPLLLVTDLHMPVMDGRELIAAARQIPGLASLPVVVLTGLRAREIGPGLQVQAILEKPLRLNQLLDVVSQHCPVSS